MSQRIKLTEANEGINAMRAVNAYVQKNLDPKLLELVRMRASQINGCAFCLHMHTEEALKAGEAAKRLVLLDAWRESNLYTDRERAALAWTESLTRIAETHAPDADFELVRKYFSQDELIALSISIAMINAFNRLAIGVRGEHPSDVPLRQAA